MIIQTLISGRKWFWSAATKPIFSNSISNSWFKSKFINDIFRKQLRYKNHNQFTYRWYYLFHVLRYLWNNSIKLIINHTGFSFFLRIRSCLIFQFIIVFFYLNSVNLNARMQTDNILLISHIYEHKLALPLFENITMNTH